MRTSWVAILQKVSYQVIKILTAFSCDSQSKAQQSQERQADEIYSDFKMWLNSFITIIKSFILIFFCYNALTYFSANAMFFYKMSDINQNWPTLVNLLSSDILSKEVTWCIITVTNYVNSEV